MFVVAVAQSFLDHLHLSFVTSFCHFLLPISDVNGEKIIPVEIKSGKTMSTSYFDNLQSWQQLTAVPEDQGYVVYVGEQSMQSSAGSFISWQELDRIPD